MKSASGHAALPVHTAPSRQVRSAFPSSSVHARIASRFSIVSIASSTGFRGAANPLSRIHCRYPIQITTCASSAA